MKILKKIRGLSLIEILVVVTIIGLLLLFTTLRILTQLHFKPYAKLERSSDPNIYMVGCENGCGECPKIYRDDPTCHSECYLKANRCKNEKGKFKQ